MTELYRLTTSLNPLRNKVKVRTLLPSLSDFGKRLTFEGSQVSAPCLVGIKGGGESAERYPMYDREFLSGRFLGFARFSFW